MKNYAEQSRKMRFGTVAIAVGFLLLGVGITFAADALLPSRHELAVESWNKSNGELVSIGDQLNRELVENNRLFCQMVDIAKADNIEISDDGKAKYRTDCFIGSL